MANNIIKLGSLKGTLNTRLSCSTDGAEGYLLTAVLRNTVSVLIPKDDKETIDAVNAAIDAAIEEALQSLVVRNQIKLPSNFRSVTT